MSNDNMLSIKKNCSSKGCALILWSFFLCFWGGVLWAIGYASIMHQEPTEANVNFYWFITGLWWIVCGIGNLMFLAGFILLIVSWVIPDTGIAAREQERKREEERMDAEARERRQERERNRLLEIERKRKEADNAYPRALALFNEDRFKEAMDGCNAILNFSPHANTFLLRALIGATQGAYRKVVEDCTSAIALDSTLDLAYWERGKALKHLIEHSHFVKFEWRSTALSDLSKIGWNSVHYSEACDAAKELKEISTFSMIFHNMTMGLVCFLIVFAVIAAIGFGIYAMT